MKSEMLRKRRAQAAIFDGIMFLLLTSISVAMIFSFMANYGEAQARTLRSSHSLNYGQSVMKSLYYIDAGELASVKLNEEGYEVGTIECDHLRLFASNSVADLLKRDISDGNFDDSFTDTRDPDAAGSAPGKLALRCVLKEMMKPVAQAGYDYYAEVLREGDFRAFPTSDIAPDPYKVTNLQSTDPLYTATQVAGCESIASALRAKNLLAIATPFSSYDENGERTDNQLRICIWPSERRS